MFKLIILMLLLWPSTSLSSIMKVNQSNEVAAKAIVSLLQKALSGTGHSFFKIVFIEKQHLPSISGLIDAVVCSTKAQIAFTVFKLQGNILEVMVNQFDYNEGYNFPKFRLIVLNSLEAYKDNHGMIGENNGDEQVLDIVYIHQTTATKLQQHFDDKYDESHHNTYEYVPKLYYLVSNEDGIDLLLMERYTRAACYRPQVSVINRFLRIQRRWEKPLEAFTRMNNFHWCAINFELGERTIYEGQNELPNYILRIFKEIAKYLQFTIQLIDSNDYDNLIEGSNHPYEIFGDTQSKTNDIDVLIPIYPKDLFFIIPPGEQYSDWEVLLIAFDFTTWILIIVTFAVAFLVVFVLHFKSLAVRNLVYGRKVTTPTLNIVSTFFGISQAVLPEGYFARCLLLLFIVWTLIIRTCYNGLLFDHLQTDNRKPPIRTIKEMLEKDFKYLITDSYQVFLQTIDENAFEKR